MSREKKLQKIIEKINLCAFAQRPREMENFKIIVVSLLWTKSLGSRFHNTFNGF